MTVNEILKSLTLKEKIRLLNGVGGWYTFDAAGKLPKIMMTVGGNDFIRSFVHISRDLYKGYGYDVTYEEVPNYTHEWDFWDMTLRKMLYEILPIRHDVILPENND